MAENVDRTITINVEDAGYQDIIENLKEIGSNTYNELKQKAQEYTDSLYEQSVAIEELIERERKLTEILREERRLQAESRYQQKMHEASGDREAEKQATTERKKAFQEIESDYREHRYVIQDMKQRFKSDSSIRGGDTGDDGYTPSDDGDEEAGGGGGGSVKKGFAMAGSIARSAGKATVWGMALSAFFSLTEFIGELFRQGGLYDENTKKAFGASNIRGFGGATQYGYSTAQASLIGANITHQRMTSEGITQAVAGQIAAERAFGMDAATLNMFNKFAPMGGTDVMSQLLLFLNTANKSKLWDIKGDLSSSDVGSIPQKLEQVAALMERESQLRLTVTGKESLGVMASFAKSYGGVFNDTRGNAAITNFGEIMKGGGGNEFMQAEIMTAIYEEAAKQGKNLDYYDIQNIMAQGEFGKVGDKSVVDLMMGKVKSRAGSNEKIGKLMISKFFPNLLGNDAMLQKIWDGDWTDVTPTSTGAYSKGDITSRGAEATGMIAQLKAQMADQFGAKGQEAIAALYPIAQDLLSISDDLISALTWVITGAAGLYQSVKKAVNDIFSGNAFTGGGTAMEKYAKLQWVKNHPGATLEQLNEAGGILWDDVNAEEFEGYKKGKIINATENEKQSLKEWGYEGVIGAVMEKQLEEMKQINKNTSPAIGGDLAALKIAGSSKSIILAT